MSGKWTRDEVAEKVDWEGGVAEAICGYGLSSSVLPDETPAEVREAWERVWSSRDDIEVISEWLWGG